MTTTLYNTSVKHMNFHLSKLMFFLSLRPVNLKYQKGNDFVLIILKSIFIHFLNLNVFLTKK